MSEYEKSVIEFEAARNEALKSYLDARPQLFVTREKECFFEAGFRMAWELNQSKITTLEQQVKQLEEANRWIPVSERLPLSESLSHSNTRYLLKYTLFGLIHYTEAAYIYNSFVNSNARKIQGALEWKPINPPSEVRE